MDELATPQTAIEKNVAQLPSLLQLHQEWIAWRKICKQIAQPWFSAMSCSLAGMHRTLSCKSMYADSSVVHKVPRFKKANIVLQPQTKGTLEALLTTTLTERVIMTAGRKPMPS